MDTIWLAEAYPWWRKHGMEARSSTVTSALIGARDEAADDRLGDHLALHTPSGAGGDGRTGRAGGGGAGALHPRLRDLEDLPEQRADADERRHSGRCATRWRSCAACSRESVRVRRATRGARRCRRCRTGRTTPREVPPVYVAATAPKMQALAGEIGDGCLTPSITTPAFVRYTRGNVGSRHRHRLHDRRLDPRDRPRRGPRRRPRDRRHVPREQGAEHPGRGRHAARPRRDSSRRRSGRSPRRWSEGGRLAAKARGHRRDPRQVQADRGHAGRTASPRSRSTATPGCTHVMLELWGDGRHEQIRLFGERVLPHVRG